MNKKEALREIEKALKMNSETNLVEFKKARGGFPKKEVRKTLSAFGNTEGGLIVLGVEEKDDKKLEVIGTENIADLQEKMTNLSAVDMNTVLRLAYYPLEIEGETILAIYVPKCENRLKPYYIKEIGLPNGAYIRDGNTDRKMTEEEVKDYVRNAQGDDFDGRCADELIKADLSIEKIENFLKKSAKKVGRVFDRVDDILLKNIGVACECDGVLRPTIAGYLIFANQNPQNSLQFERYKIRCVRYKGSGVASDIIDKADIVGTLDEQIDAMESFVLRNIKNSAKIVGTKRVERYEYPEKAIREIVANAVIHRDYRITETYTQVNIFDDRIEVFNPGNLPPGVTVENIKDAQESRNRIIAARLNEMDYLEEYGRGIDIVFTLMTEWGLLLPIFKNLSNSFKVILPGEKLSQLNERQIRIWEYLLENSRVTSKALLEKVLQGVPQPTINYDLRRMIDLGLIQKKGDARNTYYAASF